MAGNIDARDDFRAQLQLSSNIGKGIGSAVGGYFGMKENERRRNFVEMGLVRILNDPNLSDSQKRLEILQLPHAMQFEFVKQTANTLPTSYQQNAMDYRSTKAPTSRTLQQAKSYYDMAAQAELEGDDQKAAFLRDKADALVGYQVSSESAPLRNAPGPVVAAGELNAKPVPVDYNQIAKAADQFLEPNSDFSFKQRPITPPAGQMRDWQSRDIPERNRQKGQPAIPAPEGQARAWTGRDVPERKVDQAIAEAIAVTADDFKKYIGKLDPASHSELLKLINLPENDPVFIGRSKQDALQAAMARLREKYGTL